MFWGGSVTEEITLDCMVVRGDGCISAELEDELVMVSPAIDAYYAVDSVGKSIWALLSKPRSVLSLCEEMEKRYEVSPAKCREDVLGFLERLRASGLIRVE